MAPKSIRSIFFVASIMTILAATPAAHARADGTNLPGTDIPNLGTFAGWVKNGEAAQLRGVYAPNILADGVVQQPTGQATFVSTAPNVLTQFRAAASVGSTGLLAHNYLAGAQILQLRPGQMVYLVYGNGHTATYMVTQLLRYQALEPESPFSNFIDLRDNVRMSASDLFMAVYGRPGRVVFQTCIDANGDPSWGRLFVVAEPYILIRNVQ
jgi:hypothetical protein